MALRTTSPTAPSNAPYLVPKRYQEITWALKGLNGGEADAGQQTMALAWIIRELCGTYDLPYRPGNAGDTDFACGKMYVGQQIVRLINMTPEQISKLPRLGAATQEDDGSIRNM